MIYDLIVIGGGTSGCACAYIGAKNGLKTLLIEKNIHLGGAISSGFVLPAMKSDTQNINCEFYNDFVQKMSEYNAQITYKDGNSGWFNPELAKIVLDEMLSSVGCEVLFDTIVTDVTYSNISIKSTTQKYYQNISLSNKRGGENKINYQDISNQNILIKSIDCRTNNLSTYFEAKYFVDATGDANFSKICNHEFLPNENNSQALTLRFLISGIDLEKFKNWITEIDKNENVTNYYYVNNEIHLTTAYTWDDKDWALKPIFDKAVNDGLLKHSDTAYFQMFTVAGMPNTVTLNCPRIMTEKYISLDNPKDVSMALITARQQIWRLYKFCKTYLVGFENAFISNIADTLGVRESNRVKGQYIFSENDIITPKDFENVACTSDYPIDIHSTKQNASTLEYVKQTYNLPLESLKSANFKNLYIIGRCLSATFKAQAAIRTQLCCFSMGEAVAKDISKNISIKKY